MGGPVELKKSITRVQLFALLGYSLFLMLTGLLLWGGYSSFLQGYSLSSGQLVYDFFLRWFIFPLTFFVVGAISYRWGGTRFSKGLTVLPFVLLESSGILFLWVHATASVSVLQFVLISAVIGASNGLLFIAFQRLLATFDLKSAGSIVIGSAVLSPIFYFVFKLVPTALISMLVVYIVLVPLCALFFWIAYRHADFSAACFTDVPSEHRQQVSKSMRRLLQPLVYIALSAFIIGLFQTLALSDLNARLVDSVKMVGLFISGLCLLIVWERLYPRISLDKIYQAVFPLVATSYLLLPMLGRTSTYMFIGFACTVFSIASALMVITCLEDSQGENINPVFVYAMFAGCVYLSSALGSYISYLIKAAGGMDTTGYFAVALVAVYVLCMIAFMAKRHARGNLDQAAQCEAKLEGEVPDSTHEKCKSLQMKYGLSDRELEIAELLACGRDVPSIAKKLFISENTVRTHTKNFYKKMGIHTKQDYLNLLENVRMK